MLKNTISVLIAGAMLFCLSSGAFAAEDKELDNNNMDRIQIVNYENGKVTYEDYIPKKSKSISADLKPDESVSPKKANLENEKARQHFKDAGLIDENGHFDWKAYGELPTRDETMPRSIIGNDNRYKVTKTSEKPYRYVAYLLMSYDDGNYRGTGFISGNGVVTTCGHNIYDPDIGEWANKVTVILQREGSSYPYGSTTKTKLRSNTGWTRKGNTEDDWGLIETADDLSDYVGYCGIKNPNTDIAGKIAEIPGYPKQVQDETNSYDMWTDAGDIIKQNSDDEVYYDIDTSGGNSGSPVFIDDVYVAAVHAYGGSSNHGARVKGLLYDLMKEYR